MFNDKAKALDYGIGRFDEETKDAFRSLYEKIDEDATPRDESDSTSEDPNKCPF
ncbi:MAG: hypothetical protein ACO39X_07940 [Candidatus Nanopelagicaceae bacterium]